jgi:hypothetical protein
MLQAVEKGDAEVNVATQKSIDDALASFCR